MKVAPHGLKIAFRSERPAVSVSGLLFKGPESRDLLKRLAVFGSGPFRKGPERCILFATVHIL